jgi:hypothetical protein
MPSSSAIASNARVRQRLTLGLSDAFGFSKTAGIVTHGSEAAGYLSNEVEKINWRSQDGFDSKATY